MSDAPMALQPIAQAQADQLLQRLGTIRDGGPDAEHAAAASAAALAATAVVALASIADSLYRISAVFAPPADGAA